MYGVYSENTKDLKSIATYNDNWHHYQLGIMFIIIYFISKRKFKYLLPVGIGLMMEEYAVILYQLKIPHFHYLSIQENTIMLVLVITGFGLIVYKKAFGSN
jgi:hypothetical protein